MFMIVLMVDGNGDGDDNGLVMMVMACYLMMVSG